MLCYALTPRVRPLLATRLVRGHSLAALALLAAACGGGGDTGDHGITVPPAPTVSSLLVSSGGSQRARITRTLPQAVVIRAVTAAGAPVTGASLQFTAANGGAVQPASATTNSSGEATVQWTLGPTPGAQVLTVSASGTSASVTVAATADPALRATVRILDGDDQQAETGRVVLVAPSVQLLDSTGAPIAGAHLTFTVTGGGGSVQPTSVTTDATGRAATGSWGLGAVGAQSLRVECTDADVFVQPAVTLTAVAVPVGGTVTMPARNYSIPAGNTPIITDSVTGVQFRVPGGGIGSITVASAVSGPVLPVEGATRLVVGFSGVPRVEVRTVGANGAPAIAYVYGDDRFGVITHPSTTHWWALPRTAVSADTAWYQLPKIATGSVRLWAPFRGAAFRDEWARQDLAVARKPLYVFEQSRFEALSRKSIQWWRSNLTPTTAARLAGAEDRLQVSAFGKSGWSSDNDAFYRCAQSSGSACMPMIQYPAEKLFDSLHITAHEPSHYVTHLLVGDARYFGDLEANVPLQGHMPGALALGFRNSLIEEYAHFAEFLMHGEVTQFELRSVRALNNGAQFVRNSFLNDPGPDRIDYPSIEGFGALMLAAFTRTPSQTVIYDVFGSASTTRVPTATTPTTTLLEILAKGPKTPDELRVALAPLAGSDEKLAAMLEPLGWSYRATGTLVDAAGTQLSGITLASVVRVEGVDYVQRAPAATGPNGSFTLPRVFPGKSILRAYGPKATDSVDITTVTADWGAATPTVVTLGLLKLPINLSGLTTFSVTLQGIAATNRAGSTSCSSALTVDGVVNRKDLQGYAMPPLAWTSSRFALDFVQPWAVNQASEQDYGSERVVANGTVVAGRGDTLWFDGRLERSDLRVNTRLAAINAGVKAWATTDSSAWSAVVPIAHLPMLPAPDGKSISGTLRGAAAATALGGWSYDYFSKDLRPEPLHPNFSCSYALTPSAVLTVRLAPATLSPP